MARARLLSWVGLVGLAVVALAPLPVAEAECVAPRSCVIAVAEVVSCVVLDPAREERIARYVTVLRQRGDRERARTLLDTYRGVVVQFREQSSTTHERCDKVRRRDFDVSGAIVGRTKDTPSFFFPVTRARPSPEKACGKDFPVGRQVRVLQSVPCCDGDPGPPCLLRR